MRWTPIPIVDGAYADDTRPWTFQDTCNWLPVNAEQSGTRSQSILRSPPGLKEFISFGAGPHRGARNVEGKLFLVADTHLYQVISATEVLQLGEIPGRSIVSMTHNQITNGNQLAIATGADGYCYNTVTQVFEKITDSGFPGSRVFDYINSLIIGIEPQRRFLFNSALADALAYNDIERYESEASPDRLVTLIVSHLEVWVFNQHTTEVFDNTSDPTSISNHILFVNKRVAIDLGAASAHSVATLDNAIFVVGSDGSGYRMDGYTPVRITTHAIEQAWARCDLSKCFCFTWSDRGHKVWYITFPDGFTWGYDCSSGKWHRRASVGRDRWRLNTMVEWNGDWYGGSYNSGMFYKLDWDYMMEGCDEMVSRRVTGVLHDDGNRVTVPGIRLEFDTGGEASTCSEVTPIIPIIHSLNELALIVGAAEYKGDPRSMVTVAGLAPTLSSSIPWQATNVDGTVLAARNPNGLAIWRWVSGTGYVAQTISGTTPGTAVDSVYGMAISNDGVWVLVCSPFNTGIYVYKFNGTSTYTYVGLTTTAQQATSVCFNPAETKVAVTIGSFGNYYLARYDFNSTTGALTNVAYMADIQPSGGWQHVDWIGNYILMSKGLQPRVLNATTLANVCVFGTGTTTRCYWSTSGGFIYRGLTTYTFNGSAATLLNTYISAGSGFIDSTLTAGRDYLALINSTTANDIYSVSGGVYTPVPIDITAPSGASFGALWTNLP